MPKIIVTDHVNTLRKLENFLSTEKLCKFAPLFGATFVLNFLLIDLASLTDVHQGIATIVCRRSDVADFFTLGGNMFDLRLLDDAVISAGPSRRNKSAEYSIALRISKRGFDIVMSVLLLPFLIIFALALLLLNPFYNKGSLFFVQRRMGRNCRSFRAIKFRTMRAVPKISRGADSPLETDRITPLGGFLRKSRIDELPQIINVLFGKMSLIGPRPDYFDHAVEYHAVEYLEKIPGYRERHAVRPGISGLAQTELGYVEGMDATRRKVQADLYYISNMSFALEAWVFWRTLSVVARRGGA
ncbi:sugar transferase [Antarctobacter heliothermus]|uniref:sugar transferase n=1 Tax=Antarctobacter heliothermus TaxID=74033 RepID=UPI0020C7EAD3|nr:sugar transferase [Antarctobacter heliothermus]